MNHQAYVSTWKTSHVSQESRKALHDLFKDNQVTWGPSENEKSDFYFNDLIALMPHERKVTQLETFLMDVENQVNGWPLEPGEHGYDDQPVYQGDVLIPHIKVWDDAVQKFLEYHAQPFGRNCWIAHWRKTRKWRYLIYGLGERDPTDEQSEQAATEVLGPPFSVWVDGWMESFKPRSTRPSISKLTAALTREASTSSSSISQADFPDLSTQFRT
jgi:hypothetical protein